MSETTVGREPIQICKISQQLCTNTFGVSPCAAVLIDADANTKCFNTYGTCRDVGNYADGAPLDLYFAKPNVNIGGITGIDGGDANTLFDTILDGGDAFTVFSSGVDGGDAFSFADPYIIPSLNSASTAPTSINITGADKNVSPLGYRAVLKVSFSDHPHTDRVVDPYLSDRTYDPFERGSFWSKWLIRNRYYKGFPVTIYDGYVGQDLSAMRSREYILDNISGPDSSGMVSVTAKDILSKAESQKAIAPLASPGELYEDIDDVATEFEVSGGVLADYDASGTIKIGSEIILFSSVLFANNRVVFTVSERGADGSIASEHSFGDNVQNVLEYTAENSWDIVKDLLINHAGIDSGYIIDADWEAEGSTYLADFVLTAKVAEPTPVGQLIGELCEQSLLYIWWDEVEKVVRLRAVRGITSPPATLSDDNNIIAGSLRQADRADRRVSQVWTGYNQRDLSEGVKEDNFAFYDVLADLESESDNKYGEKSVRRIFSRWLDSRALVTEMNSKLMGRFSENVREITLDVDAKDRQYWVGDVVYVSHYAIIDQYGANDVRLWQIISAEETMPGETLRLTLDDAALDGVVTVWADAAASDWVGDGSDAFDGMWYTDENGLMPDGSSGTLLV